MVALLELGGDDQWSNIIAGVELIRRKEAKTFLWYDIQPSH